MEKRLGIDDCENPYPKKPSLKCQREYGHLGYCYYQFKNNDELWW